MKIRFDNNGFSFTIEADDTKRNILKYAIKQIRQNKEDFKMKQVNLNEFKIIKNGERKINKKTKRS
jgi:hypothetical protein